MTPTAMAAASADVVAPVAPGRLGEAIGARDLMTYLDGLLTWLDDRRSRLDALDTAAQATADSERYTPDVVLALSVWQSVRTRADELLAVWDDGRVTEVERERMSQLVWGRVDTRAGASPVSLPEALTLCDAMVSALRTRLAFDPDTADVVARLRGVRAALVRAEDLAGSDTAAHERLTALRDREQRLSAQAARGGDVSGPLTELETRTAHAERDLMVAVSQRRSAARARVDAQATAAALEAREPALHALAERCRREVAHPPRLAVPDVSRLGPVPLDRDALDAFVARLDAVRRALDAAQDAYSAPLRERAELRYRLGRAASLASSNGRDASPTVRAAHDEARDAVGTTPCDVGLARALVEQYEHLARPLPGGPGGAR
ncbi:hypothetical protein [Cellulomonas wangsupingiae]|uniref:DUF349 domain-containing protein n=2 Tax=Cellulomonas wangsupingiae TaxID=2968085 RepID=A0ABY5K8C3_9CELL|nr:hypothetical protein [Cellulomonas wangsupingiae]UUI64658.1 hypothetical protein NP075_16290 [Cellulomonas wangsupingiae]